MINEKHIELGNLLKWFASQKIFVSVDLMKDEDNKVAYFYETEEDKNLGNYRFLVVSRVYDFGLKVAGDITETGNVSKELTAREIVDMYQKWVGEGKPHKKDTHNGFDLETDLLFGYEDETKPVYVGFDEDDEPGVAVVGCEDDNEEGNQ